eukprot:scaffold5_cov112-Isochrysis_galbana.AAC.8
MAYAYVRSTLGARHAFGPSQPIAASASALGRSAIGIGSASASASGRMRQDTLLSSGGLASLPFPPPPFTFSPGARPIIS